MTTFIMIDKVDIFGKRKYIKTVKITVHLLKRSHALLNSVLQFKINLSKKEMNFIVKIMLLRYARCEVYLRQLI